jgi:hypothetical protein
MSISDLIGSSPKFLAALNEMKLVAPIDCIVLIQGETGTGKEVVAQAIHNASANFAGRSSIISGFSPTSASNVFTTSSKDFLLSNLMRTPLKGISCGLEVVIVILLGH